MSPVPAGKIRSGDIWRFFAGDFFREVLRGGYRLKIRAAASAQFDGSSTVRTGVFDGI